MRIYQAVNLVNGKRYIGITGNSLARRRTQHLSDARRPTRKTTKPLQNALRHYGADLFRFSVLKVCASIEEAKAEEIRLIALWRPEYNVAAGGEGAFGRKASAQERARLASYRVGKSGTFKGRKHSAESIAAIRRWRAAHPEHDPRTGRRHSEATKRKIAERTAARGTAGSYWLGKKRSPETIEKIKATKRLRSQMKPPVTP